MHAKTETAVKQLFQPPSTPHPPSHRQPHPGFRHLSPGSDVNLIVEIRSQQIQLVFFNLQCTLQTWKLRKLRLYCTEVYETEFFFCQKNRHKFTSSVILHFFDKCSFFALSICWYFKRPPVSPCADVVTFIKIF